MCCDSPDSRSTHMAPEERRHVTLSKGQSETAVGRKLIELLTELSADGNVSREEMERLRGWLEIDHGVDFPALAFLYETINQISSDGENYRRRDSIVSPLEAVSTDQSRERLFRLAHRRQLNRCDLPRARLLHPHAGHARWLPIDRGQRRADGGIRSVGAPFLLRWLRWCTDG